MKIDPLITEILLESERSKSSLGDLAKLLGSEYDRSIGHQSYYQDGSIKVVKKPFSLAHDIISGIIGYFEDEEEYPDQNSQQFYGNSINAIVNLAWLQFYNGDVPEDYNWSNLLVSPESLDFQSQKQINNKYKELSAYNEEATRFIDFIANSFDLGADSLKTQLDKWVQKFIVLFGQQFGDYLVKFLVLLKVKFTTKTGIKKGIEGYIPYLTWARPPSKLQLVKTFPFIDRLNQLNNYRLEMIHGC